MSRYDQLIAVLDYSTVALPHRLSSPPFITIKTPTHHQKHYHVDQSVANVTHQRDIILVDTSSEPTPSIEELNDTVTP